MVTIVTAASSNHFKSAKQFLRSCDESATVIFYDIGLTCEESTDLQREFPKTVYRVLDFSLLPDFAKLTEPCAGAYAWKPYIINEVYQELNDGIMIWCDAGNVITDFKELCNVVKQSGIYSPASCYSVADLTHPDCLERLRVPRMFTKYVMRNAALVGFVCGDKIINQFVSDWKVNSMIKEIIIPETSDRSNHRWDQSILTCLMYNWDVRCTYNIIGVLIHQDCD